MKWGLGIEHEMRLRFTNKLDVLNLEDDNIKYIYNQFGYIPEYLFINSSLLLEIYKKYVNKLLINKPLNNPIITNDIDQNINDLVMQKKEYPFDDIKYFDINNKPQTRKYLKKYFNLYQNTHFIFLNQNFFLYLDNTSNNYKYNFHLYSDQITKFHDSTYKVELDEIQKLFKNLINGNFEKEYIHLIKIYLDNYNFNTIEIKENKYIHIKIDENNKTSERITIKLLDKFLSKNNKINNIPSSIDILKFKNDNNFIDLLSKMHKNGIPHIDYSAETTALEFKTFEYRLVT